MIFTEKTCCIAISNILKWLVNILHIFDLKNKIDIECIKICPYNLPNICNISLILVLKNGEPAVAL